MKTQLITLLLFISSLSNIGAQTQIGSTLFGENIGDKFGYSVSMSEDGNIIAIGTPLYFDSNLVGQVKIFKWENDDWMQMGNTIYGTEEWDFAGHSVSLSSDGETLAVGCITPTNAPITGKAKVYKWIDEAWIQIGNDIEGETIGDHFGYDVSLSADGMRVAISAPYNSEKGEFAGHIRVYELSEGDWVQMGNDIDGEAAQDLSGTSISLASDGSRVAIGALFNDGNGESSGHVRVFEFLEEEWVQVGADIDGTFPFDLAGTVSLSADGNRLVIGGNNNSVMGEYSGYLRAFEWSNDNWVQLGEDIFGEEPEDSLGESVSISSDGNFIAAGAPFSDNGNTNTGSVRVFYWTEGSWQQVGNEIVGDNAADYLGNDLDIAAGGTRVIAAAYLSNDLGQYSGKVKVYEFPTVSTTNPAFKHSVTIFPNPTSGRINFDGFEAKDYEVIDILGKVVKTQHEIHRQMIDLSNLPGGIYYLKLNAGEQSVVKKVVKE